jgi:hypothetical protein
MLLILEVVQDRIQSQLLSAKEISKGLDIVATQPHLLVATLTPLAEPFYTDINSLLRP